MSETPFLEMAGVTKYFEADGRIAGRLRSLTGSARPRLQVHALDQIDLRVMQGEVLGLVGESGCGKSTLGRIAAGLMHPSQGEVRWKGRTGVQFKGEAARDMKLSVQMIFQDPMSSLNPRLRVSDIVGEAPLVHGLVTRRELDRYVDEQLSRAGFDPRLKRRYPHQFSGGQRQRISIARALAVRPQFLVCDESVSALDVSIQAQVLNLFMKLKQELGLTYLFISHDLGVIEHLSDRVAIMYLGRVVEQAPTQEIFSRPNHPYTRSLLAAVPRIDTRKATFETIAGEIPSPLNPPTGCHFHPRCPYASDRCRAERPASRKYPPAI